jgi:uncharacterized integral membrane protein (TIGR00697 family)
MFNPEFLITLLNTWPPEVDVGIELIGCLLAMMGLLRWFGLAGLYCFIATLLIVGNIQVLKGEQFALLPHPIALGTTLFGIIALTFDIITEYYGKAAALKGVRLSFFIFAFFTMLLFLTVGLKPLDPNVLTSDDMFLYTNHQHIKALFLPMPEILVASLTAYFSSQYIDVLIYFLLKGLTHERLLWLRSFLSTAISAFVDTFLFSLLAWKLLSATPVSWKTLFNVYVLGTYPLRLLCSFGFSPLVYWARYFLPRAEVK